MDIVVDVVVVLEGPVAVSWLQLGSLAKLAPAHFPLNLFSPILPQLWRCYIRRVLLRTVAPDRVDEKQGAASTELLPW